MGSHWDRSKSTHAFKFHAHDVDRMHFCESRVVFRRDLNFKVRIDLCAFHFVPVCVLFLSVVVVVQQLFLHALLAKAEIHNYSIQ